MHPIKNKLFIAANITLLLGFVNSVQAQSDDLVEEFSVDAGGTLSILSDAGPIEINTWSESRVRVEVNNSNNFEVSFEQSGNDVVVIAESQRRLGRSRIRFEVSVPENFNLDLETGGGSIEIQEITGYVNVRTSGGSIEIDDVYEGDVRATTAGGSIELRDVGGNVNAETAGGSVEVGDVSGNADLDTAGGSVQSGFVQGELIARTSGGSIELEGSGTSVSARTAGGSITIDRSNGPVNARTAGGSIRIGPTLGAINASTSGGSIEAELGTVPAGVDTSIELATSGGDVELRLPANHSATISAELEVSRRRRGDYRIYTDFPLTIQGADGSEVSARGDINGGGDRIQIRSNNGDIDILSTGN